LRREKEKHIINRGWRVKTRCMRRWDLPQGHEINGGSRSQNKPKRSTSASSMPEQYVQRQCFKADVGENPEINHVDRLPTLLQYDQSYSRKHQQAAGSQPEKRTGLLEKSTKENQERGDATEKRKKRCLPPTNEHTGDHPSTTRQSIRCVR